MAKRSLCMLLAIVAIFSLAVPAFAEEGSVVNGSKAASPSTRADDVRWTFDGTTLTISGTGKMPDFNLGGTPWYGLRDQIKKVVIESGVTNIGASAFFDCALTSVTIAKSVTSIGSNAFVYCNSLTSVTIPSSVTSIDSSAFNPCGITKISVAKGNKSYTSVDGILFNANKTELICYPNGKTASSYVVPNTVTSIGFWAFANTHLTSVTVPNGVARIGAQAFAFSSLTDITVQNPDCAIDTSGDDTLGDPKNTTIHGYAGSTAKKYAKKYGYTFKTIDKIITQLAAPTVKISQTTSGVKVSWTAVKGAPLYMVYYKENGGSWKKIGTTSKTSYTRAAKYLKNGATYQFTVRCCAADKKTLLGPYKASNKVQYIVKLAAPTVKIAQTTGGIKVSWTAVKGAPLYMVYYKENGGSWKKIGTTSKTSYTQAAKYLKNGATYQFTVRCCAADKKTLLGPYNASNKVQYTK